MDPRQDTLSGRFGGQWAFLSNPPQHEHARSLPPSSGYLRSDRSSVSPLPTGLHFHHFNASRSSLPRNLYTPSIGGHSSVTPPSQPVLLRIHSNEASLHLHPVPRRPMGRNRPPMPKNNELPPEAEFSMQRILAAIQEEIEPDINAVSEIFGRSRLVLADQHESHLPPQGEIRAAANSLQAVEEASSSNERLAADDTVLILGEDASLVEGSYSGSAAYGLLERLQAVPRPRRLRSDLPTSPIRPRAATSVRHYSAPAVLTEIGEQPDLETHVATSSRLRRSRNLLRRETVDTASPLQSRATNAVVSETYLSAGANGRTFSDPPVVSEAGRNYPLYSYDESEIFDTYSPAMPSPTSFRERIHRLLLLGELQRVIGSSLNQRAGVRDRESSAEVRLRGILERQQPATSDAPGPDRGEDQDMYD